MKLERDIELIFKILRKIVKSDHEDIYGKQINLEGYSQEKIGYHLYLMEQAGLITGTFPKSTTGPLYDRAIFLEITWEGHEFLDALENDTVFEKFKNVLEERGKDIPFKIAQKLLIKLSSTHFLQGI